MVKKPKKRWGKAPKKHWHRDSYITSACGFSFGLAASRKSDVTCKTCLRLLAKEKK